MTGRAGYVCIFTVAVILTVGGAVVQGAKTHEGKRRAAIITTGLAVGVLLAALFGPSPAWAEGYPMYVICTPGKEVNVRARATIHSDRTGYLCFGDEVTVIRSKDTRTGTWYLIDGVTEYGQGWVSGLYLTDDKPTADGREMVVASNGRVALRDGVDGKRTGWAKPGEVLQLICSSSGWAKTNRGYIRTDYLGEVIR